MEAMSLLLFVGAVWVIGAVGLFAWNVATRGHEHAERLAILPLEDNWQDPQVHGRTDSAPRTTQER
jgi:hypothetical protein